MTQRSSTAVMKEYLTLDGLRVLDVGSGAGPLVRYMTRYGAIATGLECGAAQLEKACAAEPEGGETYAEGVGQDMPFDDAAFDAVIFFNSLHHIPRAFMDQALAEAARVVCPGGIVYVAEPVAAGPSFELFAPVDDETEVRFLADAALGRAANSILNLIDTVSYDTAYHYENYDAVREEGIRIDPSRKEAFDINETVMRANFGRLGVPDEKGYRFEQPMRVNVFRKSEREDA